jgi:hypothetical protein
LFIALPLREAQHHRPAEGYEQLYEIAVVDGGRQGKAVDLDYVVAHLKYEDTVITREG